MAIGGFGANTAAGGVIVLAVNFNIDSFHSGGAKVGLVRIDAALSIDAALPIKHAMGTDSDRLRKASCEQ